MLGQQIMGEIAKEMERKEVKKTKIVSLLDCSEATAYRRLRNPDTLTVGDLEKMGNYLGMKLKFE